MTNDDVTSHIAKKYIYGHGWKGSKDFSLLISLNQIVPPYLYFEDKVDLWEAGNVMNQYKRGRIVFYETSRKEILFSKWRQVCYTC